MTGMAQHTRGRHALITGGSRGIGAAIASRLAQDGARLTLLARDLTRATDTVARLPKSAAAHAISCDITDPAAVTAALADARTRHGAIDILINNAGQAASAPLRHTSDELWQRMLAVNLTGTFLCTRNAVPDMLAGGRGRVVNIASTAGLRGYPYVTAYAAAKHGVIGLTRALALELSGTPVTVNAVCPGFTDTELLQESVAHVIETTGRSTEQARAAFVRHNPQGRLIEPAEVAATVAWLCSDAADALTGQSISVSGGEVM
ncbi:oxidoreductase (beta-hydroxyacyl-CoA dehydrogenase) protein (abmb) [Nocardia brasiliensis ATCC 700358]|uniref:3-oxoacyl-[acyl-carrier-protein] reductase MabA n=2 Tax=Nocardia brasiliensis TaxID=37326 RepID=K0ET84_NOCB7|nr:oxidoreductase (beta-hydroxyacyl-CoA dehydrogenase) protein (abmb) [Nocardia brasiliensis ATCC 700358]